MKTSKLSSKCGMIFNILAILIIASMLAVGSDSSVAAKGSSAGASAEDLLSQCFAAAKTATNALTGKVSFIGASVDNPIQQPIQGLSAASPEAAARGYLAECGFFLGLSDQKAELSLMRQTKADGGRSVVRFQQTYQGLPVFGAEVLMQLNASNDVIVVNSGILPGIKVNTQADVAATTAQKKALSAVAAKYHVSSATLKVSKAQLWIYNPMLLTSKPGMSSLVWRMEVTPVGLAPIRELVLMDAHSGKTALSINQVDTAKNRMTYTANNTTTRPGTLVCDESNPNCTGGDTDAVNAHVYGGDTYDFYSSNFGRDSIDGAGMTLISTVHYDVGYCNAFWDGYQMTYGDGCFIVADDVVGHEMTHGVTEYESGLIYAYEPGAINESLSDIFGEFVDLTNGKGNDDASVRWLMGEDTSIGAIRNMKDPTVFSEPDRMGSPYYYHGIGDNGGVHWNSGVGNKAAYLITDGDTFNGYTITGIGITKAAYIFYEAQANILLPNSTYYSLYLALNQACTTLTGSHGITADNCTQVNKATLATEMNTGAAPAGVPANDAFSGATVIVATPYTVTQDNTSATTASDDPYLSCASGYQRENSVWYSFTPTAAGTLTVNTLGSDYDTVLGVWTGSDPSTLVSVGCNDDIDYSGGNYLSQLQVAVVAGQTYQIEVASWFYAHNLVLNVTFALPPTVPTILAPTGTVITSKPTYRWSQITGAVQYRYQLMKGATLIYTKTVGSSACAGDVCKNTPTTVLGLGAYKWRVQAKIGSVWKAYSGYKTFTVTSPGSPFDSQFTSNASGWSAVSGAWRIVSPGYYRTPGLAGYWSSAVHTGIYATLDYQAGMKRTGCSYCSNNLIIRVTPRPLDSTRGWYSGYIFQYTNGGSFSVWKGVNGVYTPLINWTSYAGIHADNWNTLRVKAKGSVLKFYINGALVWSGTDTGLTSGQVGIGMYRDISTTGDNLSVDWAKLSTVVASLADQNDETLAETGEEVLNWNNPNMAP